MSDATVRHDWTPAEVLAIYRRPLLDLVHAASEVHRKHHPPSQVQLCTLLSVKTGGCSEDCAYCPQAARYDTEVGAERLLDVEEVLGHAKAAASAGATRFCMGAAWREVKDGPAFEQVLQMVRGVKQLGLEACCTLGMLSDGQAQKLKEAGLDAYNHNLDTSPTFYGEIISTRTYQDRLQTLARVRAAGITVCSGGIIGMGEKPEDRAGLLHQLATLDPHPESVPVNALVPVEGTPLADRPPIDPLELVRTIAAARLLMPKSRVRLSAGRTSLSREAQTLCFLAGANSIFYGEKLLTTPNPETDADEKLFADLGLTGLPPQSAEAR
jgi:biotin synthase